MIAPRVEPEIADSPAGRTAAVTFDADKLQHLFDALTKRGYALYGPTLNNNVVVYDEISSVEDLPTGWTDEQEGGTYRLVKRDDDAYFGYVNSPQSWKRFLHPPVTRLWHATREAHGNRFKTVDDTPESTKKAFIGVRSCELHAIGVQDLVFLGEMFTDPQYLARRRDLFVVAVNCGKSANTCFCTSLGTGPKADKGFDIALTEVIEPGRHYFVAEIGSEEGARVLGEVPHTPTTVEEIDKIEAIADDVAMSQKRSIDTKGLKELMYNSLDSAHWDEIAKRCLTCGNCTQVCPTCFCTNVEDTTDLTGSTAERIRKWDSCFTLGFSYIHGGSVRVSPKSRYRQWMMHKLGYWQDQFGTLGCVGCGRCITWCPVGIDITEEAQYFREHIDEKSTAAPAVREG